MNIATFTPAMYLAILPELALLVLILLTLIFDALWAESQRRNLGWLTFGGLLLTLVVTLLVGQPGAEPTLIWGGMLRQDWAAFLFKLVFLFGAAITALLAMDAPELGKRGEFYTLLLAATMGMNLMVSAADLMMLFVAIETTSIPLYVLAGFWRNDNKSVESGFKYLLFGATTSALMLYGFSLLFGFSGSSNLYAIALGLRAGSVPMALTIGTLLLILVGFGFKISAFPLHFWAPDVYEGAPTPVAGFLSTASKAAGFVVLMRFLLTAFPSLESFAPAFISLLAIFSMTIGNLLALGQKNIKRLLAYSSIAHAGYALVGVVAYSELGFNSVAFYLGAYLLTNLAAFGAIAVVGRIVQSDEIAAYAGLSRRSPALGLVLLVAFLSLAGMPPFAGFIAKVLVFAAAMQSGLTGLVVIGVLNSIVGLYYYLKVLNVIYHHRNEATESHPLPITFPNGLALGLLSAGIVLVGTIFAPFFSWGIAFAASFF